MNIHKHFTVCELREANVGDLVRVSWESSKDIGFIYEVDDYTRLIVLKGSPEIGQAPYSDHFRHDTLCANYGGDWIIEPVETEDDGIGYLSTEPGTIGFTAEHAMLVLGVRKQGRGTRTQIFDLNTNEVANRPQASYNIRKWKLWASAEHRDSADAEPLLLFEAQPPKPR
ncbi:hypothetical protein ASF91_10720 [Rhizobium sp. Leaf155]|nr:hypothetical protein ASF91_10720 [Rhizobium sp. Leaf155]